MLGFIKYTSNWKTPYEFIEILFLLLKCPLQLTLNSKKFGVPIAKAIIMIFSITYWIVKLVLIHLHYLLKLEVDKFPKYNFAEVSISIFSCIFKHTPSNINYKQVHHLIHYFLPYLKISYYTLRNKVKLIYSSKVCLFEVSGICGIHISFPYEVVSASKLLIWNETSFK